jgi:hypothetical protein
VLTGLGVQGKSINSSKADNFVNRCNRERRKRCGRVDGEGKSWEKGKKASYKK